MLNRTVDLTAKVLSDPVAYGFITESNYIQPFELAAQLECSVSTAREVIARVRLKMRQSANGNGVGARAES